MNSYIFLMYGGNNMNLPSSRSEPYKSKKLWWIRTLVKSQMNRFPLIKGPVTRIWTVGRHLLFKCKWKLSTFMGTYRKVDIDKICWVSPQRITYCSLREFNIYDFKGRMIGGDWDRLEKKFENLDIFIALKQVCMEGKDWTETIFYQRILNRLDRGEIIWGCKDKSDFNQRCKDLDFLYQGIRHEGYKSQREILLSQKDYDPLKVEDEVTVSIGRHGDLLFSNSAHRLAIAKLLGIQKIPIKIAVRHPKWMKFRKEILLYAKEQGGKIYQPATHPDLNDIPAFHDCEGRFITIKKNMSARQGRLLDIGANFGYFCHKFEDEGFDCYAIENSSENLLFLRKLKRTENKKYNVIAESVLECSEIRNMHFNVVLALNIFHHFLKTKESYHKFIDLLKILQMEELFFEPHLPDELQMKDAYKNYTPDEFVEFILQVSRLENAEFIGEAKDGRKIYKLYKIDRGMM